MKYDTGFKCPHCGGQHFMWRGSYAGNYRYHNEVQCMRHGCWRWSDLEKGSKHYSDVGEIWRGK